MVTIWSVESGKSSAVQGCPGLRCWSVWGHATVILSQSEVSTEDSSMVGHLTSILLTANSFKVSATLSSNFIIIRIFSQFRAQENFILEQLQICDNLCRKTQSKNWNLSATTPASNVTRSWRPWGRNASPSTPRCPLETGRDIWSRPRPHTREALRTRTSRSSVPTPFLPSWRTPGSCPSCPTPMTRCTRSRWGTGGFSSLAVSRPHRLRDCRLGMLRWRRTWWWWPPWHTPTSRDRFRCSRTSQRLLCRQQGIEFKIL